VPNRHSCLPCGLLAHSGCSSAYFLSFSISSEIIFARCHHRGVSGIVVTATVLGMSSISRNSFSSFCWNSGRCSGCLMRRRLTVVKETKDSAPIEVTNQKYIGSAFKRFLKKKRGEKGVRRILRSGSA